MFKDLRPYPSSLPERGLPHGWSTARLGSVSQLIVSNVDKLSHEDERPVRLCNYVDVYRNAAITERLEFMRATASDEEIRRFRIRHDDVLITKDSESWTDIGVPAYVRYESDDLVCGYHIAMLRTRKAALLGAFLHLSLLAPSIRHQFHVAATGVTRYGLSQADIRNAIVPVPPVEEQAAIVKYLAHAHHRIDRAIAAKRKLIALLEEQKQAAINQAVTRGLDPTAPLKDTGVPWLGQVSARWEMWPLGRLARVGNGSTPSRSNPEYWSGGHYPWLNSSYANQDRVRDSDQFVTATALTQCHLPIVRPGSVLVAITGQGKTRGKAALLEIEATINQHLAYITPRPDLADAEFLQRSLQAAYRELRRISDDSGSTKGALTCQDLKVFRVPLPPLEEQRAIVGHVDSENTTADAAIDRARREIDLLREFRTRLTSDVVTGQVDVRQIAATLPDLDLEEVIVDVSGINDGLVDEAAEFLEDVEA